MNAVLLTEADAAVPRRLRTPRNQEPREGSGVDQGWTRQPRARETQGSTPYARPNELRTERRKKKPTGVKEDDETGFKEDPGSKEPKIKKL